MYYDVYDNFNTACRHINKIYNNIDSKNYDNNHDNNNINFFKMKIKNKMFTNQQADK